MKFLAAPSIKQNRQPLAEIGPSLPCSLLVFPVLVTMWITFVPLNLLLITFVPYICCRNKNNNKLCNYPN